MGTLVTFRRDGDDVILRLNGAAAAALDELLELVDLDAFSMEESARDELTEIKFQVATALGMARA
jgi:hypothetical protein